MPISVHILRPALLAASTVLLLTACNEIPGLLGPDPRTIAKENEARAIGGACRHAMRGIEDCYTLNPKSSKHQIFAGWKDMDAYMRENKIDGTPSVFTEKPASPVRENSASDPLNMPRS